ncbi:MAG TPA: SET domain-containing protein [Kofleriaceae bacterium]|jgi:histone-lysine N-methyltransferase SETD3|nr:SET domain-containing protein [Kofleriaceae bacterium]
MDAALEVTLASVFGVELEASASAPPDDAEPGEFVRAAESIGRAIVDRGGSARPAVEPGWAALPARPDVSPAPHERAAAIERQLAWARAAGASWDGIEFCVDASGNASVRASRTLSRGEPIVTIPRGLMIVDNELAGSTTGELALGWPEPGPQDVLAAWLPLEAREPASRWRPYLDALPARLAELPMFHDADDLAALAGTAAYAIAAEKNRDVHTAYGRLSPDLRARLSLADFAWGNALVLSRGFHAPGSLDHHIALIPLVEMFNHGLGDTTWTYDPLEGFVVTAERELATGDEVHFTYGIRSNTHLMVYFGFALERNIASEAGLQFDRASDPVNEVAAHLLWKLPLELPARIRVGCRLDRRFQRALSAARLQAAGPAERARAVEAGLTPYGDLPWLGGALEDAALGVLAAAARRALAELDAHSPRAMHRPWDRICSVVRDGERAVLEQILEFATTARAYLHEPDPARLRAAAAALPDAAIGAQHLVRQYLEALADELAG